MRKLESDFKRDIVQAINDAGGYATRIEDQYRVGVLDLILSMPGTGIVLAEAKRFTGNCFEPSPRQFIEMQRVDNGGGVALLIGVRTTTGQHFLHGTNNDDERRGRVYTQYCFIQEEGEAFPELFQRWHREVISNVR